MDHREKVCMIVSHILSILITHKRKKKKKKNGYTVHTVDVFSLEDDETPAVKNVMCINII